MRVFKNKAFDKWAAKENLPDEVLWKAVQEMESGLIDANLGGHVFKKRVAIPGRGKSGGVRTLVCYLACTRDFFIYGYAKNARSNVRQDELKALKLYATQLLGYSDHALNKAVTEGVLFEVTGHE